MNIAVLSDIHGNRWALEAVLEDMHARGYQKAVNLGDSLYGPLDPSGTANLLLKFNFPTVRGNEDRILIDPIQDDPNRITLDYAKARLKQEHIDWLKALPLKRIAFDAYFLCHGSPDADDQYLLYDVDESGVHQKSHDELKDKWPHHAVSTVLCGHDHIPAIIRLAENRVIINPGSVGLQAYQDTTPLPHRMEAGSPHARYSLITKKRDEIDIEQILVEYDWKAASQTAMQNGRPDWAAWLMTGKADGM